MTDREILVHVDLEGTPTLAGRLHMRALRGRESATFEYAGPWLAHPAAFALDPVHLPLSRGAFHSASGEALFTGLSDSSPDRWGRTLIARQARIERLGRTLLESDYLIRVHDLTRQGALRFQEREGGPFVASGGPPIPPVVRLAELLMASDRVQADPSDGEALRVLLAPGSSLGGARPKASVIDEGDRLAIAKFPASTDDWPVVVWEQVALELAARAGVRVPQSRLVDVGGRAVLVSARFDRAEGARIPFLSAMAMIGANDREAGHSYLELADALRRHGVHVSANLEELWRRIAFNVLVSNTDDHLRNHGFCRARGGWVLSPAYDLNPMPIDVKPRVHALALDESAPEASIGTVLEVASYFGLDEARARTVLGEVVRAVTGWRDVGRRHGLKASDLDRMESAFEHDDLAEAQRLSD